MSVSPARACAFTVLRRVCEQGAYADRALHSEAASLGSRDRALATALSYGTIQRIVTLDHVAATLCSRPLEKLDPPVLTAIRMGLFQLLFLNRVARHAAVNESVELAKPSGATLVNAVLRRAAREGATILDELDDVTPERAAVLHSLPLWLVARWWEELGRDEACALMRRLNEPAESALRVNELVANVSDVRTRLLVGARPAPGLPEGLVLEEPFDAHGSELFEQGAIMPQSRGSMLVGRALDPQPGERVLDLCAAPGAKTTHLAALMRDQGEIVAIEVHPGRAKALVRTCARMLADCVRVEIADAGSIGSDGLFDRTLIDPPCSGLGTLQSRPDLRWRTSERSIQELSALQRRLLAAGAAATKPGGKLVYSVCTICRAESEDVIDEFLTTHLDYEAEHQTQLLPHRDLTDGFFIARLQRKP